jgi:hypothetical protein
MATSFMTVDLFESALRGVDDAFRAALLTLRRQHFAINSNPRYENWHETNSPITYVLTYHFRGMPYVKWSSQRSAELIEALYSHCGIPVAIKTTLKMSDLAISVNKMNFPVFEVLLLKCHGVFAPEENPLQILFQHKQYSNENRDKLPFLKLLHRHIQNGMMPAPATTFLDGDHSTTALHDTLYMRNGIHTNPDPEVVNLLIEGFGADPNISDSHGDTPLDVLEKGSEFEHSIHKHMRNGALPFRPFPNDTLAAVETARANQQDWLNRVAETKAILLRGMRRPHHLAAMMSQHPRLGAGSGLSALSGDTLKNILKLSYPPNSANDDIM